MICASIKQGIECFFMNKDGCQFAGGTCNQITEKCDGCSKAQDFPTGKYCVSFPDPASKWRFGNCNMATHIKAAPAKPVQKLNPIKASKRGGH